MDQDLHDALKRLALDIPKIKADAEQLALDVPKIKADIEQIVKDIDYLVETQMRRSKYGHSKSS